MNDPIIKEIRKNRKEIEKKCDNNWELLGKYLCDSQSKHNVKIYKGKPRKLFKYKTA